MSGMGLDPDEIASMRSKVEEDLGPFHKSFQNIEPCDGGVASRMIGLIASASFEAARYSGDTFHALVALSTEVVKDFGSNEDAVIDYLGGFVDEQGPFA